MSDLSQVSPSGSYTIDPAIMQRLPRNTQSFMQPNDFL